MASVGGPADTSDAAARHGDGATARAGPRALLRGEPAQLESEIAEVHAAIQALSLTNYRVHIENHKTERETREWLTGGADTVAKIESTAATAAARLSQLEAQLPRLHGAHVKLRQTLLHHSAVVELLEAPSIMEACVRSGMLDEALDVSEYASTLYFAHKLWLPRAPAPAATAAVEAAGGGPTSVVERVVADIHTATGDLRTAILHQLSGKVTLPLALRLLGHLRRLYSQQLLARKRTRELLALHAAEAAAAAAAAAGGSPANSENGRALPPRSAPAADRHISRASSSLFVLSAAEDQGIVAELQSEFLRCRDAWHRQELDAIPKHNANQYLLRVIDSQRVGWADVATQFLAVCHTIRPQAATASAASERRAGADDSTLNTEDLQSLSVAPPLPPAAVLAEWLRGRVTWFIRTLAATLPSVDDGAHVAFLLQQSTYAARRAGRLGADYSHLLGPIFHAHIRSLAAGRSADAVTRCATSLSSWHWAHRPAYDELPQLATAAASDVAYLQPPLDLLAHPPLAELANAAVSSYNSLRPCIPTAASSWIVQDCVLVLEALVQGLRDALHSTACPLVAFSAQGRGAPSSGASSSRATPSAPMSSADLQSLRRFSALLTAAAASLVPFLAQLASHQAGGRFTAAGFEEPATAAAPQLPSALSEAVSVAAKACASLKEELQTALKRAGVGEL